MCLPAFCIVGPIGAFSPPARLPGAIMAKLKRREYADLLKPMQQELEVVARWAEHTGARIVVLLEGRDAAGKGGAIHAIAEKLNPRQCRIVALGKPTPQEAGQWYFQRYVAHLPAAGEIVLFDRSWYNRAGVERVMGYTDEKEVKRFLENVPKFERWLVESGIVLIKLWLEVGKKEQERRFHARIEDPLRQWKLSPMDVKSFSRWYDYSRARDEMFEATSHDPAPWYVIRSDDKKRARLTAIKHILSLIPYEKVKREKVKLPKRSDKNRYRDELNLRRVKLVRDSA